MRRLSNESFEDRFKAAVSCWAQSVEAFLRFVAYAQGCFSIRFGLGGLVSLRGSFFSQIQRVHGITPAASHHSVY
jgi:hypothetical protein